jgi:hypothetical protein
MTARNSEKESMFLFAKKSPPQIDDKFLSV